MADLPEVDGVRHRWVEAHGLRFHLAEAGEGDKVVLCLHGWPQHWYEWRFLLPRLAAAGHRVIAMDLRGFGWSDAPRDGYEKENLATDVLAVLDELGIGRVKLVGHDWGGWIGYLLCLRAPERFKQYLTANKVPFTEAEWTEHREWLKGRIKYEFYFRTWDKATADRAQWADDPEVKKGIESLPKAQSLLSQAEKVYAMRK